jgi:hypothetical protein
MAAAHSMHPEFGLLCPTPRLRRRMRIAVACAVLAFIAVAVLRASNTPPSATAVAAREDGISVAQDAGPVSMLAAPSRTEAAQSEPANTRCEQTIPSITISSIAPRKTARRENRRRDPAWRDAPWWREVRVDEWDARGYGGGGRDFGRGGYVREDFFGYMR